MDDRFRTWNDRMRAVRHARLLEAARLAEKAAEGTGFRLLVSGSLSRGQTHPWSDLDLVLVPESAEAKPDFDVSWNIRKASGLTDEDAVDAMFDSEIIEPLRKGLLQSAVPVAEIPPLGDLPDPELALPRAAMSVETILGHIERRREEDAAVMLKADDHLKDVVRRSGLGIARDSLSYRTRISLKRLAVFQDGGRSPWLDDEEDLDALGELLERLAGPADEPFEREAMLTVEAAPAIRWLLSFEDRWSPDDQDEADALEKKIDGATSALRGWAEHLRNATSLTETHGLKP